MNRVIIQGERWLDADGVFINAHGGGINRFGDYYYWYGEHKGSGADGNRAYDGVRVYRSSDLHRWENLGLALDIRNGRIPALLPGCVLERPKVLYCPETKKYVMWFHYEGNGGDYRTAHCGNAAADRPEGPFAFLWRGRADTGTNPISCANAGYSRKAVETYIRKYGELPRSKWPPDKDADSMAIGYFLGQESRDITLFQDDDGKAYLVYASEYNSTLHVSRLTEDYCGFSGIWERVFVDRWMEAPCIFKCGGRYYFIGSGCTGWAPNAARSAVADHIFGPWRELGNPAVDTDCEFTYHSQSTFVLRLNDDRYLYMGDRWNPENAIDGRYILLPIDWLDGRPVIRYNDPWTLF